MIYNYTFNDSSPYFAHFNKNHDKKNGQFTFGDGNGNGVLNDHAHRRKDDPKYGALHPVNTVKRYNQIKKENSKEYKKSTDRTIKANTKLQTLTSNVEATQNADVVFASYIKSDNKIYDVLLGKKIPEDIFNENGDNVGTGQMFRSAVTNIAKSDIKVASEDSSSQRFENLYRKDKDFRNFILDDNRLQKYVDNSDASKFSSRSIFENKGYVEAQEALKRLKSGKEATSDDIKTVYRLFNYSIPYDGRSSGDTTGGKDVQKQRAKFFNELKKDGYGACLDTNDAIYNRTNATAPVIVFDMEQTIPGEVRELTMSDINSGKVRLAMKKFVTGV